MDGRAESLTRKISGRLNTVDDDLLGEQVEGLGKFESVSQSGLVQGDSLTGGDQPDLPRAEAPPGTGLFSHVDRVDQDHARPAGEPVRQSPSRHAGLSHPDSGWEVAICEQLDRPGADPVIPHDRIADAEHERAVLHGRAGRDLMAEIRLHFVSTFRTWTEQEMQGS